MPQLILVTGAARCGKSEWAETLATRSQQQVIYIATASVDPDDIEWQQRIQKHQQRRPIEWETLNAIEDLSRLIRQAENTNCILVDSLGTWVANLLSRSSEDWARIQQELIDSLQHTAATVILVSEETGWGVVPAYPSGRLFRDRLGALTRSIGAIAYPVYLVTGGHILNLSELGQPLSRAMGNGTPFTKF